MFINDPDALTTIAFIFGLLLISTLIASIHIGTMSIRRDKPAYASMAVGLMLIAALSVLSILGLLARIDHIQSAIPLTTTPVDTDRRANYYFSCMDKVKQDNVTDPDELLDASKACYTLSNYQ